jgi:regulator of replication initiation timing
VALAVSLLGCQDAKARKENEQLKAQVLELQKENGELGNRIETLTNENMSLKDENERLKTRPKVKTHKRKHRRTSSKQAPSG